ncbi:MAG: hypothetical protein CMI13_16545 [Oleibacter sp.]|nr:hypothetical protein [Thalassolituus sp.]|tara:strand:- start:537 stop:905 length:369 start_codon:yes stop_codon:yes gene_type:complete
MILFSEPTNAFAQCVTPKKTSATNFLTDYLSYNNVENLRQENTMKNLSLFMFMALSSAYFYADADELREQVQALSSSEVVETEGTSELTAAEQTDAAQATEERDADLSPVETSPQTSAQRLS